MKLHYAGSSSDWDAIALDKRTSWQRLASRTHGVITLGNTISLLGLILVLVGLFVMPSSGKFGLGLGLLVAGRVADILDGTVADRTGTKGPVGEAIDASFDKIAAIAVLVSFVYHDWLPIVPLLCVAVQVVAGSILAFTARVRHIQLHSSKVGKIATVGAWAVLFVFPIAANADRTGSHGIYIVLTAIGYIFTALFALLTWSATVGYFRGATAGLSRPVLSAIVFGVTSIRIVCAVLIVVAAAYGKWLSLLPLAIIAFMSDFFDGWLARRWKVVSAFGMAFDPLADKVVCLTLLAIAGVYVNSWYWVLFAVFFVYDTFTMTTRFVLPRPMPASRTAKLKTALLMVGLLAMIMGVFVTAVAWMAAILLIGAAVLTLQSFIGYTRALGRSLAWLEHTSGVASIDFAAWHKEHGIRAVLFDIDGTLAPWNDPTVDVEVKAALEYARKSGVAHVGLVSNMNPKHVERLAAVAKQVNASTYHVPGTPSERKPSPAMIHAALKKLDVAPKEAGFVGDKVVDVLAARRAGVARIAWVQRLGSADHPLDKLLYRPAERLLKWIIR